MPKSLFHDHAEHSIEQTNDWDQSISPNDAHCFACDVDLITFSFSTVQPIRVNAQAIVLGKELEYLLDESNHFDLFQHRGPPAFI